MKVISVVGHSKTGKTTTIENIIRELKRRGYTVGTIKEIHFHDFKMDMEGTNTHRHRQAGAETVTARGDRETDVLFDYKLPVNEILSFHKEDFVIMEGVRDTSAPKIVTAEDEEGILAKLDMTVFAISGKIAAEIDSYRDLPAIDGTRDIMRLVDLIEEMAIEPLPDVDQDCCGACGFSCMELSNRIIRGLSKREDCVVDHQETKLLIDGREIPMVPFVERILRNSVLGVVKELDGYKEDGKVEICIRK
ncbi:MAG: molybdopterin-guanine dinucleotide biosynthesis protein B [Gudongella sp.]|nr:molybdopterin-guanine dinucleotide biosynthesis protein B [Gudongella sp.]